MVIELDNQTIDLTRVGHAKPKPPAKPAPKPEKRAPSKDGSYFRDFRDPKTGVLNGPKIHGSEVAYSTASTKTFKGPEDLA